MARTSSTMLPLGTAAPDFTLSDYDGRTYRLADFAKARGLLVMFICNHCPFVVHVREQIAAVANEALAQGIAVVGVMSNDFEAYPDDAPARMRAEAAQHGYRFPYLVDAEQLVAKAFQAACTPDFYLFDAKRELVYRGQLDASRPGNDQPITGHDLRAAVYGLLAGAAPLATQIPSVGCNIKWKPGNEPAYFG